MNATIIELTGKESDSQMKEMAWRMFCNAHPIDAWHHDPEGFWRVFHEQVPNVSREQMEAHLRECQAEEERERALEEAQNN